MAGDTEDTTWLTFDIETLGLGFNSRIVCIGYMLGEEGEAHALFTRRAETERDNDKKEERMLLKFDEVLKESIAREEEKGKTVELCGFNAWSFDRRLLLARGFRYNIDFTYILNFYIHDLRLIELKYLSPNRRGTLHDLANLLNIPYQDAMKGEDVPLAWMTGGGEVDMIVKHCKEDVNLTREIAKRLKNLLLFNKKEYSGSKGNV